MSRGAPADRSALRHCCPVGRDTKTARAVFSLDTGGWPLQRSLSLTAASPLSRAQSRRRSNNDNNNDRPARETRTLHAASEFSIDSITPLAKKMMNVTVSTILNICV